jgi:hypothetical protein
MLGRFSRVILYTACATRNIFWISCAWARKPISLNVRNHYRKKINDITTQICLHGHTSVYSEICHSADICDPCLIIRQLAHPSGPLQQYPLNMTSDANLLAVTFLQFATRKYSKSFMIDISDCWFHEPLPGKLRIIAPGCKLCISYHCALNMTLSPTQSFSRLKISGNVLIRF